MTVLISIDPVQLGSRTRSRTIDRPRLVGTSSEKSSPSPRPLSRISATALPSSLVEIERRRRPTWSLSAPPKSTKACSTALVSSSASATASGVARSVDERAELAVDDDLDGVQGQHRVLDQQHERAHDLVEDDLLARLAREHLVHDGDRAHPALRLEQGGARLGLVAASGLEAQQRRDRLEVVLHPVVHLADGRLLVEDESVELAQVRDVAQQDHDDAGDVAVVEQRHAVEEDRHVVAAGRPPPSRGAPNSRDRSTTRTRSPMSRSVWPSGDA